MATITGTAILDKASIILQDATGVRWPKTTEMVGWLEDGKREVVVLKPEACVKSEALTLVASETKQSIPANGIQFVKLVRNLGADGTTLGVPIRIIDQEILDAGKTDWHSAVNSSGVVKHYAFDPRDPKHFYIYPRAGASAWQVEAVYYSSPSKVVISGKTLTSATDKISHTAHGMSDGDPICFTSLGLVAATTGHTIELEKTYYLVNKTADDFQISATLGGTPVLFDTGGTVSYVGLIDIDDIYANALIDYVLYRAYSKDAEFAGNAQRAAASYQAMAGSLGVKTQNEISRNPNLTSQPFNPNVPVRG